MLVYQRVPLYPVSSPTVFGESGAKIARSMTIPDIYGRWELPMPSAPTWERIWAWAALWWATPCSVPFTAGPSTSQAWCG
jgi:hypothetical protein